MHLLSPEDHVVVFANSSSGPKTGQSVSQSVTLTLTKVFFIFI